MISTLRATATAIGIVLAAAAFSGCTAGKDDSPPTPSAPMSSQSTTADGSRLLPESPDSGFSNGKAYSVTLTAVDGSTPDNVGHWRGEVAQLAGGDPAVVAAFNAASLSAAQQLIDQARSAHAGESTAWNYEVWPQVRFRNIAIGQWITGSDYSGSAATVFPKTVVIDSRTAQPITLADLFVNEQEGLNRLSEQTKIIRSQTYGGGTPLPEGGTEPTEGNFANWIPTADGLELHFAPYQFGARAPETITVPWSALTDVLAPSMTALADG